MSDMFDNPASGGNITDFEGSVLLITPTELRKDVLTKFGPSDATAVDLVVLDGKDAGTEYFGVLVFPKVLQAALRGNIGKNRPVLGRLARGVAKPGQSAPWVLSQPTDADKTLARAHMNKATAGAPPF